MHAMAPGKISNWFIIEGIDTQMRRRNGVLESTMTVRSALLPDHVFCTPRPSSAFPGSLPAGPVRARHTRPQDLCTHGPSSTFRHSHSRLNSARVGSFDHFSSPLHHWCLAHPHTEHVSWNMWMKARTNDAMRHAMTALWAYKAPKRYVFLTPPSEQRTIDELHLRLKTCMRKMFLSEYFFYLPSEEQSKKLLF